MILTINSNPVESYLNTNFSSPKNLNIVEECLFYNNDNKQCGFVMMHNKSKDGIIKLCSRQSQLGQR
jgi:hypothetical protein